MSPVERLEVALLVWTFLTVLANPWLEKRWLTLLSVGLSAAVTVLFVVGG